MFFENEKIELEHVMEGLDRKILAADGTMMLVEMQFAPGTAAPIHNHPHEQITYVIEGSIEMKLGDDVKVLKKGDSAYVPSDIIHGVTAIESCKVLDIFTPQRQDFLKK